MKKNKEYPATHSMDTAWFACDLDGNIAIFQFEENGPGPIPFIDLHTDELIPFLGNQDENEICFLPFTYAQVAELKFGLKDVSCVEDVRHNVNLIVKPGSIEELIKAGAVVDLCYSEKEDFYHIEYWKIDDSRIQHYIDKGYLLKAQECDIEIYFEDLRKDQSEHRLSHFPFYVYQQSYIISEAPERFVVPKSPFKLEQMSERAKKYMLKLPVRFAEKDHIEPAEFIDSQCWHYCNDTKEVDGITYMQVALTDGGFGYVKVISHNNENMIPDKWKSAPRVIDKGDEYVCDITIEE